MSLPHFQMQVLLPYMTSLLIQAFYPLPSILPAALRCIMFCVKILQHCVLIEWSTHWNYIVPLVSISVWIMAGAELFYCFSSNWSRIDSSSVFHRDGNDCPPQHHPASSHLLYQRRNLRQKLSDSFSFTQPFLVNILSSSLLIHHAYFYKVWLFTCGEVCWFIAGISFQQGHG